MVIITSNLDNPYQNSDQYKEVSKETNSQGEEIKTYEKNLTCCSRFCIGILAFGATLSIIPCICKSQKIINWWKQATEGVDRKIVCIRENSLENAEGKHVQKKASKKKSVKFGNQRARYFQKEEPAEEIQRLKSSINLIEINSMNGINSQASLIKPDSNIQPLATPKLAVNIHITNESDRNRSS